MKQSKLPVLIGGSRAGEEITKAHKIGHNWPLILYKPSRITIEEYRKLSKTDEIMYKPPDDVYEFDGANYIFKKKVSYDPRDVK